MKHNSNCPTVGLSPRRTTSPAEKMRNNNQILQLHLQRLQEKLITYFGQIGKIKKNETKKKQTQIF